MFGLTALVLFHCQFVEDEFLQQIPLRVPGQESGAHIAGMDPFVRGPEITEVR